MRRVRPFRRQRNLGGQIHAASGLVEVNGICKLPAILVRRELFGNLDKLGIADVTGAVVVRAAHGFRHDVKCFRRPAAPFFQIKILQRVQFFQQNHAAGTRRRRNVNIISPVAGGQRLLFDGGVIRQIVRRNETFASVHFSNDFVGDNSVVKSVRPGVSEQLQCPREVGLRETVADFPQTSAGFSEHALKLCFFGRGGQHLVQQIHEKFLERETIARQRHGGFNQFRPRQFAKTFVRQRETANRARNGDRPRRELGFLFRIHGRPRRRRCALPKIKRDRIAPAVRRMDEHEAAAADIARRRISHTQSETHRDGGIHRIAAAFQNGDSRIRRQPGDAHGDALTAFD